MNYTRVYSSYFSNEASKLFNGLKVMRA